MIHLRPDCLVFKMSTGENIPCSVEEVTIELMGDSTAWVDQPLIKNAAKAVLHYFKTELKCTSVSVAEFSQALERVLRGLGLDVKSAEAPTNLSVLNSDLRALAAESGKGFELVFFPRLREELSRQLGRSPRLVRFSGLRSCVKQLAGAKRWSVRCQSLSDQIVEFLRTCLQEQKRAEPCAILVI